MATDKNDDLENEDDFNQDNQSDFNDADDNFGLPDVEYDPIDRDDDTANSDAEDTYVYSDTSDETVSNTQGESEYEDYAEDEYIPGSYTPPNEENHAPKIVAAIIILLLIGVGVWYFGFHMPEQDRIEQAKIEKQKQEDALEKKEAAARAEEERQRQEALAADRDAEQQQNVEAEQKVGSIETISSRTGRYYVVVASDIDGDLAMDYAKKQEKAGLNTFIIEPFGKSLFYRIAIANFDSWNDAQIDADSKKAEYGDGVWVIKY